MTNPWRKIATCAAAGTGGSLCISYGLREFLRATDGGYYCCHHWMYQIEGVAFTSIGWLILLIGTVPLYRGLVDQ